MISIIDSTSRIISQYNFLQSIIIGQKKICQDSNFTVLIELNDGRNIRLIQKPSSDNIYYIDKVYKEWISESQYEDELEKIKLIDLAPESVIAKIDKAMQKMINKGEINIHSLENI